MNSSGEQATKAGETVLVVEDEVLLRLSIAAYLRDCGYKVIEAADADEAVLVLKQSELDIAVLFTDIEMPGAMVGFGLAELEQQHKNQRLLEEVVAERRESLTPEQRRKTSRRHQGR